MSTFGNFARLDPGPTENQSGQIPGDLNTGAKTQAGTLAEQVWSFSPANFQTQSVQVRTSELPSAGYGTGERARLDGNILHNLSDRQAPGRTTKPIEAAVAYSAPAPSEDRARTLRSLLPPGPFGMRSAEVNPAPVTFDRPEARTFDLIDALSAEAPTGRTSILREATPTPNAIFTNFGRTDTGPQPILQPIVQPAFPTAEQAIPKPAPAIEARADITSHPLFANLNISKTKSGDNFYVRMESPASMENLSRNVMAANFKAPNAWQDSPAPASKGKDPFAADNCYQSMEFSPDGSVKTTTTLPDLSASKIESHQGGKLLALALTDHLGRPSVEQRFDLATGQLTAQTSNRYDHEDEPMQPSYQLLQTETQTIEKKFAASGKVIASKVMPYSELGSIKSLA